MESKLKATTRLLAFFLCLTGANVVVFADSETAPSGPCGTGHPLNSGQAVLNVRDFGAAGDGTKDDTGAIQKAVDLAYSRGGGRLFFPPGTYLVTSVNLREGITLQGCGAIIRRPDDLSARLGREKAKWTRTFTTEKGPYCGVTDSRPLVIEGLTFDGNSQTQGPYRNHELEQAALLFLTASRDCPGRLHAIIKGCAFKNGVADGIHAHTNTRVEVSDCVAEDVFRGGFVLTGGHSIAEVERFVTMGKTDPTGIDVEVDSKGYDGSLKVEIRLKDIRLLDGDLDIGVKEGSLVNGTRILSASPIHLYAEDSVMTFTHCSFETAPGDRIVFPHSVTFNDCVFRASSGGPSKHGVELHAAPFVAWNLSHTKKKGQSLTFNDCRFTCGEGTENDPSGCHGILTGWDDVDFGNVLTVNGGHISGSTDVGIATKYRGGNWVIKGALIEAALPFSWTGSRDALGNAHLDITLERVIVQSRRYMHITGYPHPNRNRLAQMGIEMAESANRISSTHGLEGNQYVGGRIIIGKSPPAPSTHGLVGDRYRIVDSPAEWVCTRPGYYHVTSGKDVEAQWKKVR
jgi:hypothetical protein